MPLWRNPMCQKYDRIVLFMNVFYLLMENNEQREDITYDEVLFFYFCSEMNQREARPKSLPRDSPSEMLTLNQFLAERDYTPEIQVNIGCPKKGSGVP